MFKYQQDLDQYVVIHENKETEKKFMVIKSVFLAFIGFGGGIAVGSGFVAFLTVLGIIPRLMQLSKTFCYIRGTNGVSSSVLSLADG